MSKTIKEVLEALKPDISVDEKISRLLVLYEFDDIDFWIRNNEVVFDEENYNEIPLEDIVYNLVCEYMTVHNIDDSYFNSVYGLITKYKLFS